MVSRRVVKKAPKIGDEQLRDYELVLVFSPEIAEDGVNAAIGKVSQFVTEKGGTVSTVEQWGKRRLAYPIKHFAEGFYVLARFKMDPKFARELKANLLITEEVLRHLLVKVE